MGTVARRSEEPHAHRTERLGLEGPISIYKGSAERAIAVWLLGRPQLQPGTIRTFTIRHEEHCRGMTHQELCDCLPVISVVEECGTWVNGKGLRMFGRRRRVPVFATLFKLFGSLPRATNEQMGHLEKTGW